MDAGVPALLWSTNGDIYAQSSLEMYSYLQNASTKLPTFGPMRQDQNATGRYQIIMGQGGHCENIDQRITMEWFDTWLKGMKTGIEDTSTPLHAHEMISNRWLNTAAYPVAPAYTRYYLGPNKTLSPVVPAESGKDSVAWEQPDATSTLQYESPVLENAGTLAGPISASIYASSSTKNLELIATLQLVGADGSTTPISSGTVLGSLAANDPQRSWFDASGVPVRPYGRFVADEPVPEGSVKKYDFAISPRFVHIPEGSKLRLTVTTQTPTHRCSPNLGVDPCFPTSPQSESLRGSVVSLHFGPTTRTSLNLPLLKGDCWRSSDNPNPNVPYWRGNLLPGVPGPCQK